MYRFICGLLLALGFSFPVLADEVGAQQFIDSNAQRVISIVKTGGDSQRQQLEELFLDVVDYRWMARFVLGKYWAKLTSEEQEEFIATYKQYLLSLYVPKYKAYNNQEYKISSSSHVGKQVYVVAMHIVDNVANSPLKVEYRVKERSNKYMINDIIAEDVSLIATQRTDFTSFLSQKSIQDLIENLTMKVGDK